MQMQPNPIKTILATAYAVNPYKGSEDGMGWNFVLQIARYHKVVAITRENNRGAIERYMQEHPSAHYRNITFHYFDLPYYLRFWKRGGRGAMLYYQLWQRAIIGYIRKLQIDFDIAHNLNFHNDWTPSFLWKLGKPTVWGPVGHHSKIPKAYLAEYAKSYSWKETFTWTLKQYFWKFSPTLRATGKNVRHILCMNKAVKTVLPMDEKFHSVMPSVAIEMPDILPSQKDKQGFTIISVGRLVPLKGFDLTIKAFATFLRQQTDKSGIVLKIVGSGPEKDTLIKLAQKENVAEHIAFIEWMDRKALFELYKTAALFLFPSHEGAGMVVAEAMSFGLPVVCLDNDGPGEFIDKDCGIAASVGDYSQTVQELADALTLLHDDKALYERLSQGAYLKSITHFAWDNRGEQLKSLYSTII